MAISTDDGKTWKNFKSLFTSAGLKEQARVELEKEIGMVRANKDVGELPAKFGMAHYPNAHFVKDHVFITFGVREGLRVNEDRAEMMPGQRRLLIRPIKWLYEE